MSDTGVLLQQVINGLSLGAMYALLALGFTLVSWEDVVIEPETGFVLQADCIFVI